MRRSKSVSRRVVARLLGVQLGTLEAWAQIGIGPLPTAEGRYARTVVDDWLDEARAAERLSVESPEELSR